MGRVKVGDRDSVISHGGKWSLTPKIKPTWLGLVGLVVTMVTRLGLVDLVEVTMVTMLGLLDLEVIKR